MRDTLLIEGCTLLEDEDEAHRLSVNVLLSNITFFCNFFFAVLDVLFAVNSSLNRGFLHLLQFYYIFAAVT